MVLLIHTHRQHPAVRLSKPQFVWGGRLHLHLKRRKEIFLLNKILQKPRMLQRLRACVADLMSVPGRVILLQDLEWRTSFCTLRQRIKYITITQLNNCEYKPCTHLSASVFQTVLCFHWLRSSQRHGQRGVRSLLFHTAHAHF